MYVAEESIDRTYRLIKENVPPHAPIDSLGVVRKVEEYRQFWKPRNGICVMLLGESHVYTKKQDYELKCRRSVLDKIMLPENPDYPVNFVRFVYCLGSGENDLLTRKVDKNKKWQFWKIFSSCVAENERNLGFHKILKSKKKGTPNLEQRLANKVNIARKMQKRGIWLVDASIVGVNKLDRKKTKNEIFRICWRNHVSSVISKSRPKHIIVIGKGVGNVLHSELQKLKIPFEILPQPRGRRNEYYKKFQRICRKYCNL